MMRRLSGASSGPVLLAPFLLTLRLLLPLLAVPVVEVLPVLEGVGAAAGPAVGFAALRICSKACSCCSVVARVSGSCWGSPDCCNCCRMLLPSSCCWAAGLDRAASGVCSRPADCAIAMNSDSMWNAAADRSQLAGLVGWAAHTDATRNGTCKQTKSAAAHCDLLPKSKESVADGICYINAVVIGHESTARMHVGAGQVNGQPAAFNCLGAQLYCCVGGCCSARGPCHVATTFNFPATTSAMGYCLAAS